MLVAFSTVVIADETAILPAFPDIELSEGWTTGVGASTELRWRGLKLSEDRFVGAGATYTSKERDGYVFDTVKWFGSVTVASVKIPDVEFGLADDIDVYGKASIGITGKVYDGSGDYVLAYTHSRFDGVSQDDYSFGVSGYVYDGIKLGGTIGYTDDVFGMFGDAMFGNAFVRFDTWEDTHTTFTYGGQEDSDLDGYSYYEVAIDRDFGDHVTAKIAYTDVSDGVSYPSAFTDDSFRLDLVYKF